MSASTAKKIRQLNRREFRTQVKQDSADYARHMAQTIRRRPRWIPVWLWLRLVQLVLDI